MGAILSKLAKGKSAVETDNEKKINLENVTTGQSQFEEMAEEFEEMEILAYINPPKSNLLVDQQPNNEDPAEMTYSKLAAMDLLIRDLIKVIDFQLVALDMLMNYWKSESNQINDETSEICNMVLKKQVLVIEKVIDVLYTVDKKTFISSNLLPERSVTSIFNQLDELSETMIKRYKYLQNVWNSQENKIKPLADLQIANVNQVETQIQNENEVSYSVRHTFDQLKSALCRLESRVEDVFNETSNIENPNLKIKNELCRVQTNKLPANAGNKIGSLSLLESTAQAPRIISVVPIPVSKAAIYQYGDYIIVGDSLAAVVIKQPYVEISKEAVAGELAQLPAIKKVVIILGYDDHAMANFDVHTFVSIYGELIDWFKNKNADAIVTTRVPPIRDVINKSYWEILDNINVKLTKLASNRGVKCVKFDQIFVKIDENSCKDESLYFDKGGKLQTRLRTHLYSSSRVTEYHSPSLLITIQGLIMMKSKLDSALNMTGDESKKSGRATGRKRSATRNNTSDFESAVRSKKRWCPGRPLI